MTNKFEFFREHLTSHIVPSARQQKPTLLDVGCRGCELKPYVSDFVDYDGADLLQNPAGTVRYVGDLENGLPIDDRAYGYVAALDIVEHLSDPVAGLDELLRVTEDKLFVIIPNLAHLVPRLKFLFSGELSQKYDFVYPPPKDRHRWLTTQSQSDQFFDRYAKDRGITLRTHWHLDGRKKERLAKLLRATRFSPDLWVWSSLYVLSRH